MTVISLPAGVSAQPDGVIGAAPEAGAADAAPASISASVATRPARPSVSLIPSPWEIVARSYATSFTSSSRYPHRVQEERPQTSPLAGAPAGRADGQFVLVETSPSFSQSAP